MRMGLHDGSLLGNCIFCRDIIKDTEDCYQDACAVLFNNKLLCGACLLLLKPSVLAAHVRYIKEFHSQRKKQVAAHGYYVDKETGRLVKVSE